MGCRGPGVALLWGSMAKRRRLRAQPLDYLQEDAKWPQGPFDEDAPEVLDFYLGIMERLKAACKDAKRKEGKEIAEIASDAKVGTATVYNILNGKSWCELPTIYRLERALDVPLWDHGHITPPLTGGVIDMSDQTVD